MTSQTLTGIALLTWVVFVYFRVHMETKRIRTKNVNREVQKYLEPFQQANNVVMEKQYKRIFARASATAGIGLSMIHLPEFDVVTWPDIILLYWIDYLLIIHFLFTAGFIYLCSDILLNKMIGQKWNYKGKIAWFDRNVPMWVRLAGLVICLILIAFI
jgi:hypothetical protein